MTEHSLQTGVYILSNWYILLCCDCNHSADSIHTKHTYYNRTAIPAILCNIWENRRIYWLKALHLHYIQSYRKKEYTSAPFLWTSYFMNFPILWTTCDNQIQLNVQECYATIMTHSVFMNRFSYPFVLIKTAFECIHSFYCNTSNTRTLSRVTMNMQESNVESRSSLKLLNSSEIM